MKELREEHDTATICCQILKSCSDDDEGCRENFAKEFNLLAEQAAHRHPVFSGVQLFNVNYKLLLGLGGSVTAYVIILFQVNDLV